MLRRGARATPAPRDAGVRDLAIATRPARGLAATRDKPLDSTGHPHILAALPGGQRM
jgi:hypothetical protein